MDILASEFPEACAKIVCNGVMGTNRTVHGLALDEVKSALQKYARRGLLDKSILVLMDAMSLQLAPTASKSSKQAVATNITNRLLVIAVEDCLHPGILPKVWSNYNTWNNNRNTIEGITALHDLYTLLVLARKGRLPSIVKLLAKEPIPDNNNTNFTAMLKAGDLRCVSLIPEADGWKVIKDIMQNNAVIQALFEMHTHLKAKKHVEAYLFYYHALVLTAYSPRVTDWLEAPDIDTPKTSNILDLYREHMSKTSDIVLDDYCLDMHTHRGKLKGKGAMDFALEGAVVVNEDTTIIPPDVAKAYKEMYLQSKMPSNTPKQPKSNKTIKAPEFQVSTKAIPLMPMPTEFVPLMQQTCVNNPMTYAITLPDGAKAAMKPTLRPDPVIFDACKPVFGLLPHGARLARFACTFRIVYNNKQRDYPITPSTPKIYLLTDIICEEDGTIAPMASTVKEEIFKDPKQTQELFKIALVRALFRVTDFNPRNVLIKHDGTMVSIDEEQMFSDDFVIPHWLHVRKGALAHPNALRNALKEVLDTCQKPKFTSELKHALPYVDAKAAEDVVQYVIARAATLEADLRAQIGSEFI